MAWRKWISAVLPSLFMAGCQTGAVEPITKIQARSLPAPVVTRQVSNQLSQILKLEPYPFSNPPPVLPLRDLWFWTVPYPTAVPGVCAADYVTVYFRPASARQSGAHTPVLPEHLEVQPHYRLTLPPGTAHGKEQPDEVPFADYEACAKLDPLKTEFITATGPEDVEQAAYWLTVAQSQLARQGSAPFECADDTKDNICAGGLSKLRLDDISNVAGCQWSFQRCLDLFVGSWSVKIVLRTDKGGTTISRIEIGETVTIADRRAD